VRPRPSDYGENQSRLTHLDKDNERYNAGQGPVQKAHSKRSKKEKRGGLEENPTTKNKKIGGEYRDTPDPKRGD